MAKGFGGMGNSGALYQSANNRGAATIIQPATFASDYLLARGKEERDRRERDAERAQKRKEYESKLAQIDFTSTGEPAVDEMASQAFDATMQKIQGAIKAGDYQQAEMLRSQFGKEMQMATGVATSATKDYEAMKETGVINEDAYYDAWRARVNSTVSDNAGDFGAQIGQLREQTQMDLIMNTPTFERTEQGAVQLSNSALLNTAEVGQNFLSTVGETGVTSGTSSYYTDDKGNIVTTDKETGETTKTIFRRVQKADGSIKYVMDDVNEETLKDFVGAARSDRYLNKTVVDYVQAKYQLDGDAEITDEQYAEGMKFVLNPQASGAFKTAEDKKVDTSLERAKVGSGSRQKTQKGIDQAKFLAQALMGNQQVIGADADLSPVEFKFEGATVDGLDLTGKWPEDMRVQGKDGKQKPHMVVLGEQDPDTGLAPMYIQATRGGKIDRYGGEDARALLTRFGVSVEDVQNYEGGIYDEDRDNFNAAFLGIGGNIIEGEDGSISVDFTDRQEYNVQDKLQELRDNQRPTLYSSINTLVGDGLNTENIELLSAPATSGGLVGHTILLDGNERMKITKVETIPGVVFGVKKDQVYVYNEKGERSTMTLDALRGFLKESEALTMTSETDENTDENNTDPTATE